jgi:predicted nucleotidyltransferase
MSGLTPYQQEVARLFFSCAAADGFLLAGGGALLASGLTTRPTEDLDFFGERGRSNVLLVHTQFVDAAAERGWKVTTVRESPTFVRLRIEGTETMAVDIAIDAPASELRSMFRVWAAELNEG